MQPYREPAGPRTLGRREFIKLFGLAGGAALLGLSTAGCTSSPQQERKTLYPQVISGEFNSLNENELELKVRANNFEKINYGANDLYEKNVINGELLPPEYSVKLDVSRFTRSSNTHGEAKLLINTAAKNLAQRTSYIWFFDGDSLYPTKAPAVSTKFSFGKNALTVDFSHEVDIVYSVDDKFSKYVSLNKHQTGSRLVIDFSELRSGKYQEPFDFRIGGARDTAPSARLSLKLNEIYISQL